MRNRTRNSFSYGSTWMSLAPFWIADISIRLTRRMTGASPPCFSSDDDVDLLVVLEHLDVVVDDRGRFLEGLGDHLERGRAVQVADACGGAAFFAALLAGSAAGAAGG